MTRAEARRSALALLAALLASGPARAGEIFAGLYAHDVAPARDRIEHGMDVQAGWRGDPILPFLGGPRPHLLVSVNRAGGSDFAAAGLSWKLGSRFYLRPGIGIAVQDGHVHSAPGPGPDRHIPFGSPILFEPELAIGTRIAPLLSIEASWVHLSHAYLFGKNNPGLDTAGLRLNLAFP